MKMMVKLTTSVNFTKILQAAIALIIISPKNYNHIEAVLNTFIQNSCLLNVSEVDYRCQV